MTGTTSTTPSAISGDANEFDLGAEMERLARQSRRALPLLLVAAAMVVGGLYYATYRLVALDSEISVKQEELRRLNNAIEAARAQLYKAQNAANDQEAEKARTEAAVLLGSASEAGADLDTPGKASALAMPPEAPLPKVDPSIVKDLVSLLNGPERRRVSDALAAATGSQPEVLIALAAAALPERDVRAYRVNLYILVTLSKMPGWPKVATEAQKDKFRMVASLPALRHDATYRKWSDIVSKQAS